MDSTDRPRCRSWLVQQLTERTCPEILHADRAVRYMIKSISLYYLSTPSELFDCKLQQMTRFEIS